MKGKRSTFLVWIILLASLVLLVLYMTDGDQPVPREDYAVFEQDLEAGQVAEVQIDSNVLTVTRWGTGHRYSVLGVADEALQHRLSEAGVVYRWGAEQGLLDRLLIPALVILAVLVFVLVFLKRMSGGNQNILSLRKSRARQIPEASAVTFADVGGLDDAKDRLRDVIDFLTHPDRWQQAGVRLPRAVLLEGPPGCGKTLLARAVAGEAEVPFFFVSASEFVEMFVGVGAARVRDMFENAAKTAPAVVFIDELDAVGRRRGSGIGAGHDEREQTLNQLLVCLDGFETHRQVVVLAATNRADILDKALTRPGRFDARITISDPDPEQRQRILEVHTRNKPVAADVSLEQLAAETEGFHGADLENLVNEAGLLAVRRARDNGGQTEITRDDVGRARELVQRRDARFNKLDSALIESTSQLVQPTGRARVRITLEGGSEVCGDLIWADANLLKIGTEDGQELVISKHQLRRLEALGGTEAEARGAAPQDPWAGRRGPTG